ncbi:MAG: SDR family NAD(P)-dependent oxidoreductase [Acidimicrobiia bacterium]
MDLAGKAALVTGGGTGIGRSTALLLAAAGCSVAVNYNRSADAAHDVVDRVRSHDVEALSVQGDVASDIDCRRMVDEAVASLGRLDVLVNNAGTTVHVAHDELDGLDAADWHSLYDVNTIGPWQMMRAAAGPLRRDGGGEVVNVSSVAGVAGIGSSLAYCASKAALNNLTVTMARVLAPEVRVNAVAPGFVTGRWWIESHGEETHDMIRDAMRESSPLKSVCTPDDVAASILGLITGPDLVTAQILVIDAGQLT